MDARTALRAICGSLRARLDICSRRQYTLYIRAKSYYKTRAAGRKIIKNAVRELKLHKIVTEQLDSLPAASKNRININLGILIIDRKPRLRATEESN